MKNASNIHKFSHFTFIMVALLFNNFSSSLFSIDNRVHLLLMVQQLLDSLFKPSFLICAKYCRTDSALSITTTNKNHMKQQQQHSSLSFVKLNTQIGKLTICLIFCHCNIFAGYFISILSYSEKNL